MPADRPRIGIPVDCKVIGDDPSHTVGEKYLAAVAHTAAGLPLILPARAGGTGQASLEAEIGADEQLADMDGLFLTGSPSNMAPWRYGSDAAGVGPFDPQRDASNLALIAAALARNMPILAVCRGFQELNVACGGTLHSAVQEVPGLFDHRDDHDAPRPARYAPAHAVRLRGGGWLAEWLGEREIMVNSLHSQGIDRLGPSLVAEAHAADGLVEAIRHPSRDFALGVQWHPEWRHADNPVSLALLGRFGEAARRYRRQRLAA